MKRKAGFQAFLEAKDPPYHGKKIGVKDYKTDLEGKGEGSR